MSRTAHGPWGHFPSSIGHPVRTFDHMATDTFEESAIYRYPGRVYDSNGDLIGVGPWSRVLATANRLAVEAGEEAPFQMPDRQPFGDDPNDSVEVYPEAWVVARLADDPRQDVVEVVARSRRVDELLRLADIEIAQPPVPPG